MSKIFSLKNLLIIIIALFLFSAFISTPVFAKGLTSAEKGLEITANEGFKNENLNKKLNISMIIGKTIGIVLSFVGVLFLILIIYAGFTWMLARGNEAEVKKAKDLMYDAIIGLIIIMMAYAITAFVGEKIAK